MFNLAKQCCSTNHSTLIKDMFSNNAFHSAFPWLNESYRCFWKVRGPRFPPPFTVWNFKRSNGKWAQYSGLNHLTMKRCVRFIICQHKSHVYLTLLWSKKTAINGKQWASVESHQPLSFLYFTDFLGPVRCKAFPSSNTC